MPINIIDNCIRDFRDGLQMPEYKNTFDKTVTDWAVKQAYRDVKRTLKGISDYATARDKALDKISEEVLGYLLSGKPCESQEEFNTLHNQLCMTWVNVFAGTDTGSYGKAQKIVNMTFKYLYCVDYYKKNYIKKANYFRYCHMALDSYTLSWMSQNKYISSKIKINRSIKWSNLDEENYMEYAKYAIESIANTEAFVGATALEAEFLIWYAAKVFDVAKKYQEYKKRLEEFSSTLRSEKAVKAKSMDAYIGKLM